MNVDTLVISQNEAIEKLEQYQRIALKKRTREDQKLLALYDQVAGGARVLNLTAAFRQTGLNDFKQPRLAISRADWPQVFCQAWSLPGLPGYGVKFSDVTGWRNHVRDITVALNVPYSCIFERTIVSPVPHIPPSARPRFGLHNYHILFEVKQWSVYPVDPFLMKRISGMLFAVLAEWELSPLEASLLESMREGV